MRIGGGIEKPYSNPDEWYRLVSELGEYVRQQAMLAGVSLP